MNTIDTALEQRVWQRVYGSALPESDRELPILQLYSTARECAELYRTLKTETTGMLSQRCALLERQMLQALRTLAQLYEGKHIPQNSLTGCPGCSRRQKLERALLWMQEWTRRCRELENCPRRGSRFKQLSHLGENHCKLLRSLLGGKR